jgi:hypothetical protein
LAVADFGRAVLYRQIARKPIVFDEVKYEGNGTQRWGQLSGEEMALRFWMGTIAGTYVSHGEALSNPRGVWLSKGGELIGTSPQRIAFLKQILDAAPANIEPIDQYYETRMGGKAGEYYLVYFGETKPTEWPFALPGKNDGPLADGMQFKVDLIDTWNMTITPIDEQFRIRRRSQYGFRADPERSVPLPGRPYMALRIQRIGGDQPATSRPAVTPSNEQ